MVRRTHHERTTAMQKLNHFCCSSMFGENHRDRVSWDRKSRVRVVIVFREGTFTF